MRFNFAQAFVMLFLSVSLLHLACGENDSSDKQAIKDSDKLALEEFFAAIPPGSEIRWDIYNKAIDICSSLKGVECNEDKTRVIGIQLNGVGLRGSIPSKALAHLDALEKLDLSKNNLTGYFPFEICVISSLKTLNLQDNQLDGPLPPFLPQKLEVLDLSFNRFSGQVPFLDMPNLKYFDISHNYKLYGSIPSSLEKFSSDSFQRCVFLCGYPKKGCLWHLIRIALGLLFTHQTYRITKMLLRNASFPSPAGTSHLHGTPQNQPTLDLVLCPGPRTDVLGVGTMGSTYRMQFESVMLSVKRLDRLTDLRSNYESTLQGLSNVRYENHNVATIMAWSKRVVAYEYQPGGTLRELVHANRDDANRVPLLWRTRVRLAYGVARGLACIHRFTGRSNGVLGVHGNIKSGNILINNHGDPLLSEAGLYAIMSDLVSRGMGYAAPEVRRNNGHGKQADIFSYGVLLLELLTGRHPLQYPSTGQMVDLVNWSRSVDMAEFYDEEIFDAPIEERTRMLNLAFLCVNEIQNERPHMNHVAAEIGSL